MKFHCAHLVFFLSVGYLPVLMLNAKHAKSSFDYWENRKFEMAKVFEPIQPYCDDIIKSIYDHKPSGHVNTNPVKALLEMIDKPWWYDRDVGPKTTCARVFLMMWDMFGFIDEDDVMGRQEGLKCHQEEGKVCGGRLVTGTFDAFSPIGGFPLIWDVENLSGTVHIKNLESYKIANALLFSFPITMIVCCLIWVCNSESKHFLYAYVGCWALYLMLLLFPFPAFIISEVDAKFTTDMDAYKDHMIIQQENSLSDYDQFAQWIINTFWDVGCILTYQTPLTIMVGLIASWAAFVNSLQAIGEKRIHMISTLIELGITGMVGCLLITVMAILSTFKPSFDATMPARLSDFWELIFPKKFVDVFVVVLYFLAFVFLYANFIFERLRYWTGKNIYILFRIACIAAAVFCFVFTGQYLNLKAQVPETPFFVESLIIFGIVNFIIGRFICFMFLRPELIKDPDFGWYQIVMNGCLPTVERCFYVAPMALVPRSSEEETDSSAKSEDWAGARKGPSVIDMREVQYQEEKQRGTYRAPPPIPQRAWKNNGREPLLVNQL